MWRLIRLAIDEPMQDIQDATVTGSQRQIVLVSPFFYPELISTGKANQHLAEAFAASGHRVTVICSHPIYPAWVPNRSEAKLPGVDIQRGGAWVRYSASMPLRRLILESWFALYALVRVWRMRKQADVAVSVLPPSLFAFLLHRILPRTVRRVAVVHDLQGVLAAQRDGLPRRAIISLIHAVESRAFRAQDLCIFFSEDMASAAEDSYDLDSSQIAVQYPFITLPRDSDLFQESPNRQNLAGIFSPDRLHVVYSGALGYKQNSRELVVLMQAAAEHFPEIQFHVLSGGPFFDRLSAEYQNISGPRVFFHPLVAEQDLPELYARSAIQIIPQAEGTEAGALPSKLPNLLAAGVYLLGICGAESEVGRIVRQAGTGSVVERWDRELFLTRLGAALETVRREPASARRARVEPLLGLFSVGNLVRLSLGQLEPDGKIQEATRNSEPDTIAVHTGARG